MDAPVGKVAGEVPPLRPAPLHHGGGGVVEGVEGGVVVCFPAPVPEGAPPALPPRRPVEDGGHVVVVVRGPEGGAQGVAQGAEGLGGALQLLLDQPLAPGIGGRLRDGAGTQPVQHPLRGQQGQDTGPHARQAQGGHA